MGRLIDVDKETLLRAFFIFVNWAEECDFGYDNIPEEYQRYRNVLEERGIGYVEGLMWIAIWEAERSKDAAVLLCSSIEEDKDEGTN